MAAWISSTGISHHNILPHIPSIQLSAVNSSPRPGIASESLNSSSQPLKPSREPESLSGACTAPARTVWFSFHLGCYRSAVSLLALNVSPPTQTIARGAQVSVSVPLPAEDRSSPNTSAFSPSSFVLPSFVWFYMFFPSCQLLLFTLSWCSAHTSVSEGVFLMYPWRETYSVSTYSSTSLFSVFSFEIQKLVLLLSFLVLYLVGPEFALLGYSYFFRFIISSDTLNHNIWSIYPYHLFISWISDLTPVVQNSVCFIFYILSEITISHRQITLLGQYKLLTSKKALAYCYAITFLLSWPFIITN